MKYSTILLSIALCMFIYYGYSQKLTVFIAANSFMILGNLEQIKEKL
jgi:hypothetical protein